ncbi:type I secretion C-terminal target domain-containing protein, partial [Pelagibius sp. CAU 1746]|uniref:type I secretion C-terminal target domain-containing protein n=1 Tax=Pelagibius sp. CAU 1746 TaxID=3140370 RepID=UPI00325C2FC6
VFTVTLTPPANSDVDVLGTLVSDLSVSATAKDGVLVSAPSSPVAIDIDVDAVADGGVGVTTGGYGTSTNGAVVDLDLTFDAQGGNVANPLGDLYNGGGFDADGSEKVTEVKVTLSGSPAIANDTDANLLFDGGFGGSVSHSAGSLEWTFTGTQAELDTLVESLQVDPRDDYEGTVSVKIDVTTTEAATELGGGSAGPADVECDDSDNEVTETFIFDVEAEAEVTLLGQIVINEVGLGVGTSIEKSGGNVNPVNTEQNYIEIRNVTDNAIGTSEVKSLDIEIIGNDGVTVITINLNTASGGSIGIPAKGFLTIYEDGTWATATPNGSVQQTGTYTTPSAYTTPGSVWGVGDDTSEQIGVNLTQNNGSVDLLVANGVDKTLFTGGASGWTGAGSGSTNAQLLMASMLGNETFSGLIGDQDSLLAAIGRSDIAIDDTPSTDDEVTRIFSRVFASEDSGGDHPGDAYPIDTNQELDWTTNNQPTELAYNNDDLPAPGVDDLNPQDDSDDLNPAQGAGTNGEDAGQTVIDVSEGGEADADIDETSDDLLVGGRGQDFLFGDNDANTLQGGDHNDFLFGDQGDDRLEGEKGADLLVDVDGEDVLIGGAGDDVLIGGEERLSGDVAVADTSGDLLVGDNIIEGEVPTFNVVYVMDVSGSMSWDFAGNEPGDPGFTPPTRLDLAKEAFLTLNQQIIDAGFAGVVNIKVVPFSSSGVDSTSLEFARADDPNLAAEINALTANGATEYESPLQIAADWLTDDIGGGVERHVGSENFIFFLSDGGDNSGYNPSAGLQNDLYNGGISNLSIEAFGFGAPGGSDFVPDELDRVETNSTGPTSGADFATIVDDVSKIQQIFSGISLTDENFGEDVILGGSGGDMIFGDTLVVDPGFMGTDAAYAQMVFNDIEGPALRLPLDTIGLSDWIEGGAGNDSIMGQAGDDTIAGQEGDDVVYGGDGEDVVIHTLSEETGPNGNHYDGGRGIDKLVLNLTAAEAGNATIAQAVQDLAAFIAANSDPSSISGSGALGSFAVLGLEVRNFEELEVLVDGAPIPPNADNFTLVTNQSTPFDVDESYIAHFGDDGIGGPVSLNSVAGSASYSAPDVTVNGGFTYVVENGNMTVSAPGTVTLVDDSNDNTLEGTTGRDLIIGKSVAPADNVTVTGAVAEGSTFSTGNDQFSFTLSTAVPGLSITQIVIDLGNAGDFDPGDKDFTTGPSNTVGGTSSAVTDGDSTLTITIPAGNFASGNTLTFGIDTDDANADLDHGIDFGEEDIPVTITLSDGTVLNGTYVVDGSASSLTITGVAESTLDHLELLGLAGDDVLLGGDLDDTLDGGAGDDLLNGGAGDDVLTGGADADTFAFVYGGGFEVDTVTDFNTGDGDVIDLSSLLSGVSANPDGAELDNYLTFSTSGGDTIIDIETDGSAGFNDFRIVLENVDLTNGGALGTDEDVINALLNSGNLVV